MADVEFLFFLNLRLLKLRKKFFDDSFFLRFIFYYFINIDIYIILINFLLILRLILFFLDIYLYYIIGNFFSFLFLNKKQTNKQKKKQLFF